MIKHFLKNLLHSWHIGLYLHLSKPITPINDAHQDGLFFMYKQKQTFNKISIPVEKQIEILKLRGLYINNLAKSTHRLNTVSYYRLSAYFKSFQISKENHNFKPGTTFDDIWQLYVFDRKLRLYILEWMMEPCQYECTHAI